MDWNLSSIVSVAILHLNLFGPYILSTLYRRGSGMIAVLKHFRVMAFKVIFACARLICHRSLNISGVVVECISFEMKLSSSVSGPSQSGYVGWIALIPEIYVLFTSSASVDDTRTLLMIWPQQICGLKKLSSVSLSLQSVSQRSIDVLYIVVFYFLFMRPCDRWKDDVVRVPRVCGR